MRVLQVINSLGTGGAEKLLLDTIPLYRANGIEMDILVLWDNDFQFLNKLKELKCCKIHILNKSQNLKDVYSLKNIFKIRSVIKNYDLIHVHLFPAQYFVSLANIGLGKKLIFTEHNTTNRRISNKFIKPLEKLIYRSYKNLICISEEISNIYRDYLDNKIDISIINNGVNLSNIRNAVAYQKNDISKDLNDSDILMLQVSAFRPQKDQDTIIRALKNLPVNYKLILVGDGERKSIVETLVLENALSDRVLFLGNRMDVPELMKSSNIIILSSYYEGLSLASVEGLSSGKPFIATDVPGLREIVNGAGILFDLGNEEQLASIIMELINNDNHYMRTVVACQKRAEQYDISYMVDNHIKLYQRIYAQA